MKLYFVFNRRYTADSLDSNTQREIEIHLSCREFELLIKVIEETILRRLKNPFEL